MVTVVAGLLAALTFVVHDVGYMFTHPYWLDESWVVVSTRLPFEKLGDITSVTPIGWTALMRTMVVGGDQRQRLLPLVFAALTVLAAFGFGRAVFTRPAARLVGGTLASGAALLVPSALVRDDLKQYTADAFVAVVLFWLVARLDTGWSRRRLVSIGAVGVVGMFISHTSVFVGSAAVLAIAIVQLVRRRWTRLLESCVVGAATAAGMVGLFVLFDQTHVVPSLRNYWAPYYVPWRDGWHATFSFLQTNAGVLHYAGLGPTLLCLALVVVGLVTLARLGRYATALTLPVLAGELVVASAARRYPLLDLRTSHFLLTLLAVVAAIGAGGLAVRLGRLHIAIGSAVALAAAGLFVWQAAPYLRSHPIVNEDVRSQVQYVEAHRQPGDVVIVNQGANTGFGYYYRALVPGTERVPSLQNDFAVVYPANDRIVIMTARDAAAVRQAFGQARALLAGAPVDRIWIVRSHQLDSERAAWRSVVAGSKVQTLDVGPEPLLFVEQPIG